MISHRKTKKTWIVHYNDRKSLIINVTKTTAVTIKMHKKLLHSTLYRRVVNSDVFFQEITSRQRRWQYINKHQTGPNTLQAETAKEKFLDDSSLLWSTDETELWQTWSFPGSLAQWNCSSSDETDSHFPKTPSLRKARFIPSSILHFHFKNREKPLLKIR